MAGTADKSIPNPLDRRRFLVRASAAAGTAWVVPSIVGATAASAQTSLAPIPIPGANTAVAEPVPATIPHASLESDTTSYYWYESGPTTLAAALAVDRDGSDGAFTGGSPIPGGTIPLGTTVFSYFVQADRVTSGRRVGSISFGGGYTIVGVAYKISRLTATAAFERSGVTYTYANCESGDNFTISGGSTAIAWDFGAADAVDHLRVFVAGP